LPVAVGVLILLSPEPDQTHQLTAGARDLLIAPAGIGLDAIGARSAFALSRVHLRRVQRSDGLRDTGRYTRTRLCLTVLGFVLLFSGAQLSRSVTNDMHLLWLLILLIASDSHRAMTFDAWRMDKPLWFAATQNATFRVMAPRGLLCFVYLFPGISKLRTNALD
jgi:hypothetical protein